MSLNRKLFIGSKWRLTDIKRIIERIYNTKIEVETTHSPDYMRFVFALSHDQVAKSQGGTRSMDVFVSYQYSGFTGTMLSLGIGGTSDEILINIAKTTGGFYCACDNDDTWLAFEDRNAKNMGYLAQQWEIEGGNGKDKKDFIKFLKNE